jgi:hypothetical protein
MPETESYELFTDLTEYAESQLYPFVDMVRFNALGLSEGQRIYWQELIGRAHFAGCGSAIRHLRWINGCLDSIEGLNFLTFCAAFRGLLESVADSVDALYRVPLFLAQNGDLISKILQGADLGKDVFLAEELEDSLIHFSHARKKLAADSPTSHRAQTMRTYLSVVEKAIPGSQGCYSELCEVTHPSALSVLGFVESQRTADVTIWQFKNGRDQTQISEFLARYRELCVDIIYLALNPILLTLYVIDKLPYESYRCELLKSVSLENIPQFKKIAKEIEGWSAGVVVDPR